MVGWSLIGRKASPATRSQVYHGSRAVVVVVGPEFIPFDLRMACEGGELAILSWCGRKSLLLLGRLYTFAYSYVSRSLTSMSTLACDLTIKFNDCP